MGKEHKGKGVNIALGPMMNMGRVAQGGRNWEGFGADPFLAGEAAYETILGMQEGGVQACAKHFINKCVFDGVGYRVAHVCFSEVNKSINGPSRRLMWMTEHSMRFMLIRS
jgi:hypothetical protein